MSDSIQAGLPENDSLVHAVVDAAVVEPGVLRKTTLSTGAVARFHRRKGRVLKAAQRKAGGDASAMAAALLSEVITVDDKLMAMEDIEDLDLFDLLKLQGIFSELSGEAGNVIQTPSR